MPTEVEGLAERLARMRSLLDALEQERSESERLRLKFITTNHEVLLELKRTIEAAK